jgi:hypothetical protein
MSSEPDLGSMQDASGVSGTVAKVVVAAAVAADAVITSVKAVVAPAPTYTGPTCPGAHEGRR